jgi:cytochrome c peroxidase
MLFNNASLCFQGWQSCATCHLDNARVDGLNWDLLNDGMGNPKSTKSLLLSHKTPPVMITGVRDKAETAVRAGIKFIQFSQVIEENAEAIDEYLKSLKPVPSPCLVDGKLSKNAEKGKQIFEKANCASCHPAPLYTDMKKYDVGTGKGLEKDRVFETPTLVEVWRTGPYLYDGRATTIKEVLTTYNKNDLHGTTSELNEEEIEHLAEFVLSL